MEEKNKIDWKTLCVFGTSITWGAWDRERSGWVERLKLYCFSKENEYEVYNLGISGDFSGDVLKRFDSEAEARKPNIIIFEVGGNDALYIESEGREAVSIDKFRDNLTKLARKARTYTNKIFFLGLKYVDESKTTPIPWETNYHYTNKNNKAYDDIIREVCGSEEVVYIPRLDLLNKRDLEDGLHPNARGHEKIFQQVKKFLEEEKLI
jgi:acyl-CoA thioesterase-1